MKRAEVYKARVNGAILWHIHTSGQDGICTERATWQKAIALALAEVGLAGFEIVRTHEGCSDCDRMAREAYRTARAHRNCTWMSTTTDGDGHTHTARYLVEIGVATPPEHREAP